MVEASSATAAAPANASPSPLGLWSNSWKPAACARSAAESAAHSASTETAALEKPLFIIPPLLPDSDFRPATPPPRPTVPSLRPTLAQPSSAKKPSTATTAPVRPGAEALEYNDCRYIAKLRTCLRRACADAPRRLTRPSSACVFRRRPRCPPCSPRLPRHRPGSQWRIRCSRKARDARCGGRALWRGRPPAVRI